MTNLTPKNITDTSTKYLGSVVVNDSLVNIFLEDYGQCYIFQYYDTKTQQIKEVGCGSFNINWEEEILDYFNA